MQTQFSPQVEQALNDIYYDLRAGRGQEGLALLEQAASAGDADAMCMLARCLNGSSYVWDGHHFPEDEARAAQLMQTAVEHGSAAAVLLCLRSGALTPSVERKMPFDSLRAAFDDVLAKAQAGEHFCEYMVGNVYFWWDFLRIEGKGPESFPDFSAFQEYLRKNIARCEDWFWRAYRGGVHFAASNLRRFYEEGDEDLIAPQPEKLKELWKEGAELGIPPHQYQYGLQCQEAGDLEAAEYWYRLSAEGGEPSGWYGLGVLCQKAGDDTGAAAYFQKGAEVGNVGSQNALGKAFFCGTGVETDYGQAFRWLSAAYRQGSTWGVYYLGKCCFEGWGTPQDYVRARTFLEQVDWDSNATRYLLGIIYGQGLGVPADIPKAVALLQQAKDYAPAQEELLHYKKTLFGKWVRR